MPTTTKQARLTLGMDIKPLQDATKEMKRSLEDLGKVQLDKNIKKAFRKELLREAEGQIRLYKSHLKDTREELVKITAAGDKAWDVTRVRQYVERVRQLEEGLRGVRREANSLRGGPGTGAGIGGGGGGGGGGGRGAGSGAMDEFVGGGLARGLTGGPVGRVLGAVGIGFGVQAAISRATEQARMGMEVRALTGGDLVNDSSRWGFTRMERRQRAMQVARAAGGDIRGAELNERVNLGEMLQRAFGLSGEQFGGMMGAARRGGIQDQRGFTTQVVDQGFQAGLRGSGMIEYLTAMTSHMESISNETDIDKNSMKMTAAMARMPFFASKPERIFAAIQGFQQAFKDRDPYQDFLSYRSLEEASGGRLGPAGIELRRQIPLMGGGLPKGITADRMREAGLGELLPAFQTTGQAAVEARIRQAMRDTKGMGGQARGLAFQQATGLSPMQMLPIMIRAMEAEQEGTLDQFSLTQGEVKRVKKAGMTPTDKAEANAKSFEAQIINFGKRVDDIKNKIADGISGGMLKMVDAVDNFANATGMFRSDVEKLAGIIGAGGLASVLMRGGFGGRGGTGAGAGGGVIAGAGGAGALLLGGVSAAFIGHQIGKGMRAELNEWTGGEWDRALDSFWMTLLDKMGVFTDKTQRVLNAMPAEDTKRYVEFARSQNRTLSADQLAKVWQTERSMQRKRERRAGPGMGSLAEEYVEPTMEEVFEEAFPEESEDMAEGGLVQYYRRGGKSRKKSAHQSMAASVYSAFGFRKRKPKPKPKKKKEKKRTASGFTMRESLRRAGQRAVRRKAMGGPIGTDTVPAWLTPGEFVVNARDTARNMPALVYANAGGAIEPAGGDGYEMPDMNFSGLEMATQANTSALRQLTNILMSGGGMAAPMMSFPRGSNDIYGG